MTVIGASIQPGYDAERQPALEVCRSGCNILRLSGFYPLISSLRIQETHIGPFLVGLAGLFSVIPTRLTTQIVFPGVKWEM